MKLSMWIFAEWLKDYQPKIDIKSNLFEIEAVRLFSSNMIMDKKTLYIGILRDFFQSGNNSIILTHNNDMIVLQTDDLEEILNQVLTAMEFYNDWNNTMLELLTSGATLQDLFTASHTVLSRPFFLLDAGLRMLAYNNAYKPGDVDPFWDEMLESGSVDVEFLIDFNRRFPERFQNRDLYFMNDEALPYGCYNQNFFFQNKWAGAAILIDMADDIGPGTLDLFRIFCGYLDRWFQSHIQEQQSLLLEHLLLASISDANAGTGELVRQLLLLGWQKEDNLLFIKLDAPLQPFSINSYLCRTLNFQFQHLYVVSTERSICLLCNTTKFPPEKLRDELLSWLKSNRYYGVSGQSFTMQDSFFKNYKYVEFTSEYCDKKPGELYTGSRFTLPYLLNELQNTIIPEVLHPDLHVLAKYDRLHHTEFFHTLHIYLKNERSLQATAKELKLHRNSLSYRLNRIAELIEADLEDALTRLYLLISFEIYSGHSYDQS